MPTRSQLVCRLCVRTLMHNCVSASHRQHPHKSQLQNSALGKCANRTQWADRAGSDISMGRRGEEERRTSQGSSLPDINVAFVSTLLLLRCKRCAPEWLSTRSPANQIGNTQIREYTDQNSPLAVGFQQQGHLFE